jgi:2-polyprenyl-6-hydroxyphenyl methylase/3-demethylubiquinone-9 3-methyltransferase
MTAFAYAILGVGKLEASMSASQSASLDPSEVAKFSALAAEWWNPKGKFAVLHVFNPVRLAFIKEQVTARLGLDPFARRPFDGLRFLDIGCGGGLLSEPMARLGALTTGVDPSEKNIKTASVHAAEQGLAIDYRAATAEDLAAAGEQFDVILNMEVIEHVADPARFTVTCASLLKPGGLMFVATINRTLKAFGLAIVGAEYVLGWLPKGTHQWEKFITPDELEGWLKDNAVTVKERTGVTYSPLRNTWNRSRDMEVNYMVVGQKDVGDGSAG